VRSIATAALGAEDKGTGLLLTYDLALKKKVGGSNSICWEPWDIVILDIPLPDMDGLEVLKSERSDTVVLVLSIYPEEMFALRMLKAWAAGYLTRDRAQDKSVATAWKVLGDSKHITASLAEKMAFDMGPVHKLLVAGAATSEHMFGLLGVAGVAP